jgi:hypothetical protein
MIDPGLIALLSMIIIRATAVLTGGIPRCIHAVSSLY